MISTQIEQYEKRKSILSIRFKMIKIEAHYRRDLFASYLIIMDDWQ